MTAKKRSLAVNALALIMLVPFWSLTSESSPSSSVLLPAQGNARTYNFDSDAPGKIPAGFHSALTGKGKEGTWVVKQDDTAPSKPNVLAQTSSEKTDYHFPICIADEGSYRDLDLSVKFKAVSGSIDRGAGLVFRLKDSNNYYVVRANALEDNYNLYKTINGRRLFITGTKFKVPSGEWHEIRVECVGNKITCYFDGAKKIERVDNTFSEAGKVGLWTKADSVMFFDDMRVAEK